jgi:hypothetical protein
VLECDCASLEPAAGFTELAGVDYELGLGEDAIALSSTDTRMFWAFRPADSSPEDHPLFVFFNGGPGVSSGMLLGLSTGPSSFAPELTGPDLELVANPHSWTSLGNLLWIDARHTGFSYGLLDDPGDIEARDAAMALDSFNSYIDAADVLRTLLRFLAEHPSLRDNPVVFVAESYGGTRAQIMLDMLFEPGAYADGSRRLRDPLLRATIEDHHLAALGEAAPTPALVAEQFGRQILIQPALAGDRQTQAAGELFEQPDSPVEALAVELGVEFLTCAELGGPCDPYENALDFVAANGRSAYDYRAPYAWLNDLFGLVNDRLNDAALVEELLAVEVASVAGLAPDARGQAWKAVNFAGVPSDAVAGTWPEQLGELEPWDRYFMTFNYEALSEFRGFAAANLDVDPDDPHYGELFLSNLRWVDTLITAADYDLAVYAPAIPATLESYTGLVDGVIVDPVGEQWLIEYSAGSFAELPDPPTRVIEAPNYAASHAVSLDAPAQLREDVGLWLGR